jgi:hypothetical protein
MGDSFIEDFHNHFLFFDNDLLMAEYPEILFQAGRYIPPINSVDYSILTIEEEQQHSITIRMANFATSKI